jgi:hypothetical protein
VDGVSVTWPTEGCGGSTRGGGADASFSGAGGAVVVVSTIVAGGAVTATEVVDAGCDAGVVDAVATIVFDGSPR